MVFVLICVPAWYTVHSVCSFLPLPRWSLANQQLWAFFTLPIHYLSWGSCLLWETLCKGKNQIRARLQHHTHLRRGAPGQPGMTTLLKKPKLFNGLIQIRIIDTNHFHPCCFWVSCPVSSLAISSCSNDCLLV